MVFVLYYPVIAAVILVGMRIENRYRPNSAERQRTEVGVGCAFLSITAMPIVLGTLSICSRASWCRFSETRNWMPANGWFFWSEPRGYWRSFPSTGRSNGNGRRVVGDKWECEAKIAKRFGLEPQLALPIPAPDKNKRGRPLRRPFNA